MGLSTQVWLYTLSPYREAETCAAQRAEATAAKEDNFIMEE